MQTMDEIILEATLKFNLSPLEDYYIDSNNRIRARGFIYDEDTGIFLNEYGLLEIEEPRIEDNKERIREIFDFRVELPIQVFSLDGIHDLEMEVLEHAVA